mgnify:CR=1 FL=1
MISKRPASLRVSSERGKLVVAATVGQELPGGGRLGLLRIAREALVHPVVLRTRAELEAMGDALGHDEEIALAVGDGSERRLERARALVDEEHESGRVMLEEVVHGRSGRRHVHGRRGIGHEPAHAAIDIARGRGLQTCRGRGERRRPDGAATPSAARSSRRRGAGSPRRASSSAGRDDRCGSPCRRSRRARAPARRRGGGAGPHGRPRHDADLGNAAEVLELLHGDLQLHRGEEARGAPSVPAIL